MGGEEEKPCDCQQDGVSANLPLWLEVPPQTNLPFKIKSHYFDFNKFVC